MGQRKRERTEQLREEVIWRQEMRYSQAEIEQYNFSQLVKSGTIMENASEQNQRENEMAYG